MKTHHHFSFLLIRRYAAQNAPLLLQGILCYKYIDAGRRLQVTANKKCFKYYQLYTNSKQIYSNTITKRARKISWPVLIFLCPGSDELARIQMSHMTYMLYNIYMIHMLYMISIEHSF